MKEYYKIGEISNLYGIGADSLRYYEDIGILKPRRDDNGYRMYSISDIRTLNILRELRTIGFSMAEIKDHLKDFDLEKTLSLFQKGIATIEEKISALSSLKDQLVSRTNEIKDHLKSTEDMGKIQMLTLPSRNILQLTENVYRDEDLDFIIKKLQKENEDQLYLIGNGNIGATIPLNYISSGNYGHFNSVFCIVNSGDFDATLPGGPHLCVSIKGSYSKIPAAWKRLFTQLKERNLIPEGNPLELYLIDNHDTNDESQYVTQLQIKVREKNPQTKRGSSV